MREGMKLWRVASLDEFATLITGLLQQCGMPVSLSAVGCSSPSEHNSIIKAVNAERLMNNPFPIEVDGLLQ
jgi:hypothetical protein